MRKNKNMIGIPHAALTRIIYPDMRKKVFLEILDVYQKRYNLKLMYAFLNTDSELIADYACVFQTRNTANTADLVVFLVPPIYTELSTPGYRYCRNNKIASKWFESGIKMMVALTKENFYGFIVNVLELSLDKKSPAYWKNPENYFVVLTGLQDLSHVYNKP